jgi:hypothetical protein
LLFQLKCSHHVLAKAPLSQEAIFKRNQATTERRRAMRMEKYKEKEIAKRDRNDNHIKPHKSGERNVSYEEDPSPTLAWSGEEPSVAIDWSYMSGLPSASPHQAVEVSSSWRLEPAIREKGVGSSSQLGARPAREDQRVTRFQAALGARAPPRGGGILHTGMIRPSSRWSMIPLPIVSTAAPTARMRAP